mgnify:CR=1 FL=1
MVDSLKKPGFEEMRTGVKVPAKEALLTPRFYTTDFDEMARMDISVNEAELKAILEEFRTDYNRHHFVPRVLLRFCGSALCRATFFWGYLNRRGSSGKSDRRFPPIRTLQERGRRERKLRGCEA